MPENSENLEPFADIDIDAMSVKLIDYLRKELGSKSVNYLKPLTRLTGGYETFICRFQLSGVDDRLSKPLIIRVYAENSDYYQPLKESMVQNAMADQGYPVPAVYSTCTDKTILGGAFIIMDYFEGKTLLDSNMPFDQVFDVLGNLHAKLHNIDPEPIVKKFTETGMDSRVLKFESMLKGFRTQVNLNFFWLNEAAEWLFENRPNDPEILSVCHDDFHPRNILFKDGKVKAVLDWSGFLIGDPAMDVALTIFLITIPTKLLSPDLDSEQLREMYLNAYRNTRPLDETNIAYYGTVRRALALKEGAQGHVVWGHPEIIQLLLASIYEITGVKIEIPS
jgi:aminoglycoside phosphotransferase (APT) family kinase protein